MQIVASIQFLQPRAFPIENGTAGVALATIFTAARHTGIKHDRVNYVAIVQIVARYVVNMVDVDLLQPTRRAEATLRGSTGTDHRHDLVTLFTGLLQTEFIKIGVESGLETRFSSF
jgi:hypothetical protein